MKILIAEDDLTSRFMLASVLQKCGYQISEAGNGQEAWQALQKDDAPRVAIFDWVMPEMDGLELIRKVRAIPSDNPIYIIMLTSRNLKADIIIALDAGADDYLSKPFVPEELIARVKVGFRMVRMQDRLARQVKELQNALQQNKILRGILPICMFCKKIRNDQGYWDQVEAYVSKHSPAEFSHGICPDCMKSHYPDVHEDIDENPSA
jgi:phosphoserine phosphatase RsbU/P